MRSSKKAIIVSVVFLLVIALFTVGISEILMRSEYYHCCDNKNRQRLEGKINVLFTGASHGMNGFNTEVIDKKINCVSYNLSGPAMGFRARYYLMKQEIERNHIDTVVIDITFNSLLKESGGSGDIFALPRIYTMKERLKYFFTKIPLSDMTGLIGNMMHDGIYIMESKLIGKNSLLGTENNLDNVDYEAKGYRKTLTNDLTLSDSEVESCLNSMTISVDYPKDNIKYLNKSIELCKEKNIRVIVVVIPISDNFIWTYDEWYKFHDYLIEYCKEKDIEFFDFNLLKNRYSIFNDKNTFTDSVHMSEEGSIVFSEKMCEIFNLSLTKQDLSDLFYSSYEEMKADSPYMKIYKNIKK